MRVRFPSLLGERERATLEAAEIEFREFVEKAHAAGRGTRTVYPAVRATRREELLVVREFAVASWPFLRRVEATQEGETRLQIGVRSSSLEDALGAVRSEIGVDLTGTRVRVGIVRGHMLEISWFVPLDVRGGREAIEDAADELCERLLGTDDYETWVRSNHVADAPRRSGLRALASEKSPMTYPLDEAGGLLLHTVRLLEQERRNFAQVSSGVWTALELGESEADAPQSERRFVSTSEPEAIKCFLEGALFASRRFVTEGAYFLSVVSSVTDARSDDRSGRRGAFEEILERGEGRALVGTGFGEKRDYFDLLLRDEAALESLVRDLESLNERVELEFWDSELEKESFSVG